MEYITALLQTVLWVGLIAGCLWKFYSPVHGILAALQKRVEDGSNIKAGPLEITSQLKPSDAMQQRQKLEIELQDDTEENAKFPLPFPQKRQVSHSQNIQSKSFQAEDLALRALQEEYGVTISRQVTAGADMGFDGAFVKNGRFNIIEVKLINGPLSSISSLRSSVNRLIQAIFRYRWRNVQIILALVFDNDQDIKATQPTLEELTSNTEIPVTIRFYSFSDLQQKFGLIS